MKIIDYIDANVMQYYNDRNKLYLLQTLGFIDGHTGKCMIMPVTKDAKPVSPKREYLLLYPYIMPYGIEERMTVFTESYSTIGEDLISYIKK